MAPEPAPPVTQGQSWPGHLPELATPLVLALEKEVMSIPESDSESRRLCPSKAHAGTKPAVFQKTLQAKAQVGKTGSAGVPLAL